MESDRSTINRRVVQYGLIVSFVFVVVFLWPVLLHIGNPVWMHDDIPYGYFLFDNNFTHIVRLDFAHLFDTRMFYPLTNTLALGNSMLGPSILGLPVYIITRDTIASANSVMVLNFFLTFLFTYLFTFRITGNKQGAVIAGVVYTYNPYMMSRLHQELIVFQWIPLTFLAAEELLRSVSWRWAFTGVLSVLMALMSSFYYVFYILLFVPVYMVLRLVMQKTGVRHFFRPAIVMAILTVVVAGFIFLKPFVAAKSFYSVRRPFFAIVPFSASIQDFLFTTGQNVTYGWVSSIRGMQRLWASSSAVINPNDHPYEHTLFPGLTAILLLAIAIWFLIRGRYTKNEKRIIIPLMWVAGLSFLCAFGPTITLGSWEIPSLYRLVYFLPGAETLRAASRLVVISYFALAALISYGLARIKPKTTMFIFILLILCFEYRYDFGNFDSVPVSTRNFYARVSARDDVSVIIELPMANGEVFNNPLLDRYDSEDATYLLYALYHNKKLVNGYSGYIPMEYRTMGETLDLNFPTKEKISMLKKNHIDAVIVHLDEYKYPGLGFDVVSGLRALGLREIAHTDSIYAFRL